jgi:hypothetical protein
MLHFRLTTECRSSRPTATIDLTERWIESSMDLGDNEEQQRENRQLCSLIRSR